MPPWMRATFAWMRRQLAWSNSRRSWQERLAVLGLGLALGASWYVSRPWGIDLRLALLAVWLVILAVVLRRGLIKLVGPVFFFEALRGTRRRVHLYRALYAIALLVAITYVWAAYMLDRPVTAVDDLHMQAEFAQTIFLVFFCVQMLVIACLTPVVVASAIAEDKERRTLEFVLATDLRGREIVLGKLAGRMANMTLYLIAGVPILSLMQLLGGIDPELLLASFVVAIVTYGSVAAVSILMSVLQRRSRDAVVFTFLAIVLYHVVSAALRLLLIIPGVVTASVTVAGMTISPGDAIEVADSGNFFVQLVGIVEASQGGGAGIHHMLGGVLREYTIFHAVVMLICLFWATARLRPIALSQMGASQSRAARRRRSPNPEIGRWPMLWKEVFGGRARLHWLAILTVALIILLSFVPPVWITVEYFHELVAALPESGAFAAEPPWGNPWHRYGQAINVWVRVMSGLAGTLLLIAVAVRAAGSVSGERARQTLDELLASPLSNAEIVIPKWLGAIFSVRPMWLWLGAVFLTGMITGGLSPVGALATFAAWVGFAAVFAAVGLWFSIHARSTFRATVYTLLTTLFLLGLHWLVSTFCCLIPLELMVDQPSRELREWGMSFQLGLTPPATLSFFPIMGFHELRDLHDEDFARIVFFQIFGVGVYILAACALAPILVNRFGVVFSRTHYRQPERRGPRSGPPPLEVLPADPASGTLPPHDGTPTLPNTG